MKDNKTIIEDMTQLLSGLDYIHKNNIAHKNLKPENILVVPSFEQAKDLDGSGFGCDIWSLDCVFYELYYLKQFDPNNKDLSKKENLIEEMVKGMLNKDNKLTCENHWTESQ